MTKTTSEDIETLLGNFYRGVLDIHKEDEGYKLLYEKSRGNTDYFELDIPKLPFIINPYLSSKFDKIIQKYRSSGIEDLVKSENYVPAKISNNPWRRRIKIRTPEGYLEIWGQRSYLRFLDLIFPTLFGSGNVRPGWERMRYRIRGKFKRFKRN